jgi:hypothetical protein
MQDAGCRRQEAGGRMQETGSRRQDAGCRKREAGEPGSRKPGSRMHEPGTDISLKHL